jgi:probable F420-dependent oxidoreductase
MATFSPVSQTNPPLLSLGLPNFGSFVEGEGWRNLITVTQAAEAAGFGRVIVVDHVVMGPHTDAYQWGRFPTPPDAPWFEPLTVLTMLAGATTTIRLGTGIIIAPLRSGAVLAKTAATLDVLSGGRLDLGVGTGWQSEEYDAVGLDFAQRGQLLDDTLAVCTALWNEWPAAVDLPTISFDQTWCVPKPAQPGGVPLWVSGTLLRPVFDRVVNWGSGWIPIMGATVDDIRAGVDRLRAAFSEAGRDPATLQVRGPLDVVRDGDKRVDIAATMAGVRPLLEAGVTDVHIPLAALSRNAAEATAMFADVVGGFVEAARS